MNWLTDSSISYAELRRWFKLEQARHVVRGYRLNVGRYNEIIQLEWYQVVVIKREAQIHLSRMEQVGASKNQLDKVKEEYISELAKHKGEGRAARLGLAALTRDYNDSVKLLIENTPARRYWQAYFAGLCAECFARGGIAW